VLLGLEAGYVGSFTITVLQHRNTISPKHAHIASLAVTSAPLPPFPADNPQLVATCTAGLRFGLSTLASAGLGNTFADVIGVSAASGIEVRGGELAPSSGGWGWLSLHRATRARLPAGARSSKRCTSLHPAHATHACRACPRSSPSSRTRQSCQKRSPRCGARGVSPLAVVLAGRLQCCSVSSRERC